MIKIAVCLLLLVTILTFQTVLGEAIPEADPGRYGGHHGGGKYGGGHHGGGHYGGGHHGGYNHKGGHYG